jgi:hypothetical protein
LPEARQSYLTPRKAWRRQDRLLCQKTSLTAEKLGLSATRQVYPQPTNVSGRHDKLIGGKTTLSAFRTKLSAAGQRYQGARITLSATNQGYQPGNKVVSPQISLSAFRQACSALARIPQTPS